MMIHPCDAILLCSESCCQKDPLGTLSNCCPVPIHSLHPFSDLSQRMHIHQGLGPERDNNKMQPTIYYVVPRSVLNVKSRIERSNPSRSGLSLRHPKERLNKSNRASINYRFILGTTIILKWSCKMSMQQQRMGI